MSDTLKKDLPPSNIPTPSLQLQAEPFQLKLMVISLQGLRVTANQDPVVSVFGVRRCNLTARAGWLA